MTISLKRGQWRAGNASSEQLSAALREPDERAALVHHQPAALDRQIQTGFVFIRRALLANRNGPLINSM